MRKKETKKENAHYKPKEKQEKHKNSVKKNSVLNNKKDKMRNKERNKEREAHSSQKKKEKHKNSASKQQKRQDEKERNKERERSLQAKRKARQVPEFGEKELATKQNVRRNEHVKEKEKITSLKSKRNARKKPGQLEHERLVKQAQRELQREREREKERVSKAIKRKNVEFKENEARLVKKRCTGETIDDCIDKFHIIVAEGPIYVCTCCHQTWFRRSVKKLGSICLSDESKQLCTNYKSIDDAEWLCITCIAAMRENRVPRLSVANGMRWPEKPDVLNLHPLEERLISQRIPFMQIRELPRGGQLSVKGNIVNVPVDIQPTINVLPRQIDENVTIAVKLKKRISHKSACFTENVRPASVMLALKWLMCNSNLYKDSGIRINSGWESDITNSNNEVIREYTGNSEETEDREVETVNSFCEVSGDECIQGNLDTLVDDADADTNKVYTFAPGENQKPLSLYEDKDAEYLCFPTIFCGERREENENRKVALHYSDIAKWELRSADRRAAQSVPNIFFKLKKIQTKQISDKVNLAVRRYKTEGKKITAGQVKDPVQSKEIVKLNEGYYIFRTLRNSPAYLSSKKKDAFAMIRQLGLPTWFMSLSSADTRWPDLLKTLAQLDGKICTDDEARSMDWNTKTKYIQRDPVTCARYFDHRVQVFINTVLKSDHKPIGLVTDIFRRVEFQNRGSAHVHMLVWSKNAPVFQSNLEEDIIEYVNKYVTCSLEFEDPALRELIQLQVHKHSKTCMKKGKTTCRFGFPLPPLPKTMLLSPLDEDAENYKKKYDKLQKKLNDFKDGCDLSFATFLEQVVDMTEDEYVKCIRASLKGPKIFLKRNPSEMRVNYYNPSVLKAWKANLDIQFVLDPYACATYIVSYISKSQRGISTMLEKASREAQEGNMDLKRQVRHMGNKFLNFVEVSAQEACYLVLQMPLTQASREVVFINTSPPDQRVFLLKDHEELEKLPDKSTNIHADNLFKRYARRPKQLENWCLADVVSELEVVFPKEKLQKKDEECNDDDLGTVFEDQTDDDQPFREEDVLVKLKNGISIRRRKNKRVIRYVGYSKKTNTENYYREKILLFLPWRSEETDVLGGHATFEQHYTSKGYVIKAKQVQYEHYIEELEEAQHHAESECIDFDEVAPNTQHMEVQDEMEGVHPSDEFVHFDPDTQEHRTYDIGPDIGLPRAVSDVETSAVRIPQDEYYGLLRSLNEKQREFHDHVTRWIRTKDEPLYAFLNGGAGTGKSVVIDAIYQTLHRLLCSEEGENPDDARIMLCAYTGKAAYNIKGTTIASAFHKKMYQTRQNMHADELNTFRTKYRNLCVVIIDEVSMVGNKLLAFINERLQQLTGTKRDFGGISIIAVGDLYQLAPVGDAWIFNDLSSPGQGLATNLWKEHFQMYELTEIMRQKDDLSFAQLLNRLRHNELSDDDKRIIASCRIDKSSPNYPLSAPHLFIENKFVNEFNQQHIQRLPTEKVNIKADTDVLSQTKLSSEVKRKLVEYLPDNPSNTGQLKSNLTIAREMTYDISVNIDVSDGLTNGATCVVKHIEFKDNDARPAIIWVEFTDKKIGAVRRNQYRHLSGRHVEAHWTPIFETKRTFMYNRKTFERIQFPLQPSAAKTVHKAQGTTVDELVVDLSQTRCRKIPHIHYVALSRVKQIDHLHVLNFNEKALTKDNSVDVEMDRLKTNCMKLCYKPLYAVDENFKLVFHNARSLHKHIDDLMSNPNITAADVIGIAESRLCEVDPDQTYTMNGFNMLRNDADASNSRPYHGIVMYVKSDLQICKSESYSTQNVEFSLVVVRRENVNVQCAVVYRKPTCPFPVFYSTLGDKLAPLIDPAGHLVITGDFNIDLMIPQTRLVSFMADRFCCRQIIQEATTINNTMLDLVFTNFSGSVKSGVLEAYWSDHNLVYVATEI